MATVSDMKIAHNNSGTIDNYTADIASATDYYPGGMIMPGRNFNSTNYMFGHNGQMKDDEIAGVGNIYTAEYWEYDSRLIRRWNTDPVVKPWESSYACFNGNPIYFKDPSGLNGTNHDDPKNPAPSSEPPKNPKNGDIWNILYNGHVHQYKWKKKKGDWVSTGQVHGGTLKEAVVKPTQDSKEDSPSIGQRIKDVVDFLLYLIPNVVGNSKYGDDGEVYQNQTWHKSIWPRPWDVSVFQEFMDWYSSSTYAPHSVTNKRIVPDNSTKVDDRNPMPNVTVPDPNRSSETKISVQKDKDINTQVQKTSDIIHDRPPENWIKQEGVSGNINSPEGQISWYYYSNYKILVKEWWEGKEYHNKILETHKN